MEYIKRLLEAEIRQLLAETRVVVVTGPRQVGKTTVVERVTSEQGRLYRLDDETIRKSAANDPHGFVDSDQFPIAIDEIQLGTDALIRAIKLKVDQSNVPGQFLLNGSANFLTTPHISESLAGRALFLTMWPLSQGEIGSSHDGLLDLALSHDSKDIRALSPEVLKPSDYNERICVGGFPQSVNSRSQKSRSQWFSSYVTSVTTRDIKEVADVREVDQFAKTLRVLAAETSSELVVNSLANKLQSDPRTVQRYVSLLEMIYLVHQLPNWGRNLTSRETKRSKLHISDTGLAAFLLRKNVDDLNQITDPARGPLSESFVANELLKQAELSELQPSLFHYREHEGLEVDVVASAGGSTAAFEVKAASSVSDSDVKNLLRLRGLVDNVEPGQFKNGIVFYAGKTVVPLGDRITALPISALWSA